MKVGRNELCGDTGGMRNPVCAMDERLVGAKSISAVANHKILAHVGMGNLKLRAVTWAGHESVLSFDLIHLHPPTPNLLPERQGERRVVTIS